MTELQKKTVNRRDFLAASLTAVTALTIPATALLAKDSEERIAAPIEEQLFFFSGQAGDCSGQHCSLWEPS
jgi:hypothetical protein